MKLPLLEETHPYKNYLKIKSHGLRRIKISNIKGLNRGDITDKANTVKEIGKNLKKIGKIYFHTKDISLIQIGKGYFVEGNGNNRILAIKICERLIKDKFILAEVTELHARKSDIEKAKDKLISYLIKYSRNRLYCSKCDSNFNEKVTKKEDLGIGYTLKCPICNGNLS